MKILLLFALLFAAPLARAFEPQKIVIVRGGDFGAVEGLLKSGWTVAAQSSTPTSNGSKYGGPANEIHVFTLSPPTPAVAAEVEAAARIERERKTAEFAKRREEYLRQKAAAAAAAPVEK